MTNGTIIIYGGAGGIGSATGRLLRQKGYDLHLVGRTEGSLASRAAELEAGYTVGDVTDQTLFEQVTQAVPKTVAGLIYAVGTINLRSIRRLNREDFLHDFQVNAMGAAEAVQAALPALKKHSAPTSVLFYSSVAARQGFNFHASVSMAKGAIEGLTLALAAELAPQIRVNAIAPSLTQTELASGILSNEKVMATLSEQHPLKRLGTPEDIASLSAFLVSAESGWITGQIFGVDGGRSSLRS